MSVVHVEFDATALRAEYFHTFHLLLCDPPYSPHVHGHAMSHHIKDGNAEGRGARKREFGFDPLSDCLRATVALACAHVLRWSIVYSDVEDSHILRDVGRDLGAQYIRTLPWVRYSMPQLGGDRPAQGFEHVLLFHNASTDKSWNGHSNITHLTGDEGYEGYELPELTHNCLRGENKHKAEKPLDQLLDLVSWFSEPGENVLDITGGRATTALACLILGRNCVSLEINPGEVEKGNARLTELLPRDKDRILRWLNADKEPTAKPTKGPAELRAIARARDKQAARAFLEGK